MQETPRLLRPTSLVCNIDGCKKYGRDFGHRHNFNVHNWSYHKGTKPASFKPQPRDLEAAAENADKKQKSGCQGRRIKELEGLLKEHMALLHSISKEHALAQLLSTVRGFVDKETVFKSVDGGTFYAKAQLLALKAETENLNNALFVHLDVPSRCVVGLKKKCGAVCWNA
jgi:hypothetical protein